MKYFYIIALLIAIHTAQDLSAQDSITLTIDQAIRIAEEQSINAFRNKNMYLVDYWNYRNSKALFLPSLNFQTDVLDYSQGNSSEYNSSTGTYDYVASQVLSTGIGLNISQNIAATGGTMKLNYDLSRIDNFGDNKYSQYSSTPFSVSYEQEIFGFNSFKWEKKISPIEFEQAKKEYLYNTEQMKLTLVQYYFVLAQAQNNLEIARQKRENARFRYQMGIRKSELGIMKRVDLLDLEVNLKNSEVEVNQCAIYREQAQMNLNTFLQQSPNTEIVLDFNYIVPKVLLDEATILYSAMNNNPEMLNYKIDLLNAKLNLEMAKREKGFHFDLFAGYGISKIDGGYNNEQMGYEDGRIDNMFSAPFDRYSQAKIGINLPIIDWGQRRGNYKIRKAEYEIQERQYEQDIAHFKQQIIIMVRQFNLLPLNIEAAAIADQAAQQSFDIYDKYFKKGDVELIQLMNSIEQRDAAHRSYLEALYDYWYNYYAMRIYTLYDFVEEKDLSVDFDHIIE